MIYYKDFDSTCKKIAKEINKDIDDTDGTAIYNGKVYVFCSKAIIKQFSLYKSRKKYIKEINNILDGCTVSFNRVSFFDNSICFDIEFDDEEIDAETEDW